MPSIPAALSYAAAYFSVIVAAAVLLRDWRSAAHRLFACGVLLLAIEEGVRGLAYGASVPDDVYLWQRRLLAVSFLIPGVWAVFSFIYARANAEEVWAKWKGILLAATILPAGIVFAVRSNLLGLYRPRLS